MYFIKTGGTPVVYQGTVDGFSLQSLIANLIGFYKFSFY